MLRQARTFNLIFYLLLAVLAVALAPAAVRGLLACIALLPMPLQLAGSLSPDASVLGMVFCYTALCLRLRTKKPCGGKILLTALGGLSARPRPSTCRWCCSALSFQRTTLWGRRNLSGLVWCARALRAADPGGRARAGGLPVALRQPR